MNTIEKKAKAYDEAIKKAQDMLSYKELRREDAEYLFPELAESEKIRKALIECIEYNVNIAGGFGKQELIAWLEKQGEHYNFRQKIQVGDHVTRNKDGMLVNLSQLNRVAKPCDKKQGEQKPTEWSEGDISHIGYAIDGLERYIKEHPEERRILISAGPERFSSMIGQKAENKEYFSEKHPHPSVHDRKTVV